MLMIVLAVACQKSADELPTEINVNGVQVANATHNSVPGFVRIRLKNDIDSPDQVVEQLPDLKISHIERTFPYGGKFEKRLRAEGLHLWYDVVFDQSVPLTKATSTIIRSLDNVDVIEFINEVRPEYVPFNDPRLPEQWHYNNTGQKDEYVAGADINLFNAWEFETGDPRVVVAVLDNGALSTHEDLLDNMWVNEAELNGQPSVDDDGNGFVDDIYGFNFTVFSGTSTMQGDIKPNAHGTHTAGTIAAVNNNGIGVSGVAGGNGVKKGARIMNCQIMPGAGYVNRAFVYAADNGAVIASNSWSSEDGKAQSILDAIDYFIKYAGIDENGNQVGPMKGGLVIFAAGNENLTEAWPSMYENVVAVASIGPNYTKSSFSNFGSWVDISAPGGENGSTPRGNIISTSVTTTGEATYEGFCGTSMACPHVAGVAALIVSHFGGQGFTNEMLKDRLLSTANPDLLYKYNPGYTGFLGVGMVDAAAAVGAGTANPPKKVDGLTLSVSSNTITASWPIPTGEDGTGKATQFDLFWSTSDISNLDISAPLPEGVYTQNIRSGVKSAGEEISTAIADLKFNTRYYFRVDASDNMNNHSGLSKQVSTVTGKNTPPEITPCGETKVTVKKHQTAEMKFSCYDAEGHSLNYRVLDAPGVTSSMSSDNIITLKINGLQADAGTYKGLLKVWDTDTVTQNFEYTILPNHAPKVATVIDNMALGRSQSNVLNLATYFTDEDEEPLSYTVTSSSASVIVNTKISGDNLEITGNWDGTTNLTVTATDLSGSTCTQTFIVLVRDNSTSLDVFPNPVSDNLYVRTVESLDVNISFYSNSGAKVIEKTVPSSLFDPAVIDVTSLAAGTYTVKISGGSLSAVYTIVKL